MQKIEELETWLRESFKSQIEAAEKLGTTQPTLSRWVGGKQKIPLEIQKKLRKLKYLGPFGIPKAESSYVTREEFGEMKGDLQAQIRTLRDVVEKMGQAIVALSLRNPPKP